MTESIALLRDANGAITNELYEHIEAADDLLGTEPGDWTARQRTSAAKSIEQHSMVLRGMIGQHMVDNDGTCLVCPTTWPCPSLVLMHRLVKDPDGEFYRLLKDSRDCER